MSTCKTQSSTPWTRVSSAAWVTALFLALMVSRRLMSPLSYLLRISSGLSMLKLGEMPPLVSALVMMSENTLILRLRQHRRKPRSFFRISWRGMHIGLCPLSIDRHGVIIRVSTGGVPQWRATDQVIPWYSLPSIRLERRMPEYHNETLTTSNIASVSRPDGQ